MNEPWLIPGVSFRVYFNPNNPNNHRAHVRAVIDDNQIVVRVWSRRKQTWHYSVRTSYWYELLNKDGYITDVKLPNERT